jgi:hypothetical protein
VRGSLIVRSLTLIFLALWVVFAVCAVARHRSLETKAPGDWSGQAEYCDLKEGLRWLARHQEPDGHWSAKSRTSCGCSLACTGVDDEELTALCALGYLEAGYTPHNRSSYVDPIDRRTRRFSETVRKALKWLVVGQGADGALGPRDDRFLARHSLATLALADAYALTNAVYYRAPTQRAVSLLDASPALLGGWGLTERALSRDPVVTARTLLALNWAWADGLEVATRDRPGLDLRSLDDAPPTLARQETTARDCSLGSWNGPKGRLPETARTLVAIETTYSLSRLNGRSKR